jgi:hypothetical protein
MLGIGVPKSSVSSDHIRRLWEAWLATPYPTTEYRPGSADGEVDGVDLALLDGDAASVVAWYLDPELRGRGESRLQEVTRKQSLSTLEQVLPRLSIGGQSYFGQLLELLRLVDRALQEERQR